MDFDPLERPKWYLLKKPKMVTNSYELKYYENFRTTQLISGTIGTFISMCNPARGSGENQRIGNRILAKDILLTTVFRTTNEAIATPSDGMIRAIIFIDFQSNGTTPAIGDLLETGLGLMNAIYNLDNVPTRFQILDDRIVQIKQGNVVFGGGVPVYSNSIGVNVVETRLESTGSIVQYNDSGSGTTSNIKSGNIWFMYLNDALTNVSMQPAWRIHYEDL